MINAVAIRIRKDFAKLGGDDHGQDFYQSRSSTTTQGKTPINIVSPRLSHREGELHGAMPTACLGSLYEFWYIKNIYYGETRC